MRAPVSVVIPTRDAAAGLPAMLGFLGEGLQAGILREVVISDAAGADGQGDAATARIAGEWGARLIVGPAGRGGQLRRGAEAAGGAWLLFLHADSWLAPGWAGAVAGHLRHPERAGWFGLRFRGGGAAGAIVARWANLRARAGLPFGDQGLLISRALYDAVGGYPDIPLMEDMALARALRGRLVRLPAMVLTSPERYRHAGWLRQGAGNLWRQVRFFCGADPARLARGYAPPGGGPGAGQGSGR